MMMRTARRTAVAALLVCGLVACGDDDATGPGGGGGEGVSATIGGQSFRGSLATAANYTENEFTGGILAFAGTHSSGPGNTRQLTVNVVGINGTGTYQVGAGHNSIVTYVEVSLSGNNMQTATWTSTLVGGSGSVTVTELTETRARGTFEFTLVPSDQGAVGNKVVTNGKFDVPLQ